MGRRLGISALMHDVGLVVVFALMAIAAATHRRTRIFWLVALGSMPFQYFSVSPTIQNAAGSVALVSVAAAILIEMQKRKKAS